MRYLLVGNYGVGNLGDEALKEYFLKSFPDVEWQVLSAHPMMGEYPRLPAGLRSLFAPWWKTLGVLRKSQGMVFGGGTLFTDIESSYACFLWWVHAVVARIFHKPVLLAFQGVGPFHTRVGEWFARRVFRHAAFISVRDEASAKRVESWRLNKEIVQTFDPVFSLMQSQGSLKSTQNVFVIIPRNNSDATFRDQAIGFARERNPESIVILTLKPDDAREQEVCRGLVTALDGQATIVPVRSLSVLLVEVGRASSVLSQRYHGALAALALGKELTVVPQGEGDKMEELTKMHDPQGLSALVRVGEDALKTMLKSGIRPR